MMIFIVPVKSPKITHSWELLSKLFERTIKSILNQTSNNFKVIVVCHQKPEISFEDPKVEFLEVDFPIPGTDIDSKRRDKRLKIRVGLFQSRIYQPSHTMVVNADDCINRKIVEFVSQNPNEDGWLAREGYFYNEETGLFYFERKKFYKWCGTSNIIKYGLFKIPESDDYSYLNQDDVMRETYHSTHRTTTEDLVDLGKRAFIKKLPFPGAVYMIENGENIGCITTNMLINKNLAAKLKINLLNRKFLTQKIKDEFGLYPITKKKEISPLSF